MAALLFSALAVDKKIIVYMAAKSVVLSTDGCLLFSALAVDKKIIVYMAAKSVVLSTEYRQVVGQGCLPLSSTRSSPCSQQLALLALFTATGKHIWPIISLIRTFLNRLQTVEHKLIGLFIIESFSWLHRTHNTAPKLSFSTLLIHRMRKT